MNQNLWLAKVLQTVCLVFLFGVYVLILLCAFFFLFRVLL